MFAAILVLTGAEEIYSYTDSVYCHVQRTEIAFSDWSSNEISNDELLLASRIPMSIKVLYICILQDETAYDVHLPEHLIHQLDNLDDDEEVTVHFRNVLLDPTNAAIHAGDHTFLSVIQNTTAKATIYDIDDDDEDDEEQRRLAVSIGTNTILVLRVIFKGRQPTLSREQLAGRIFGRGNLAREVNMASQYAACSAGKLKFKPAVAKNALHGVVDIFVNDETVSGNNSVRVLENLAIQEATKQFGSLSSNFDHVMVILPDGDDLKLRGSGYLAYAFIGGLRSVFHDTWGGRLSILAHEIGHNLGLQHAGAGTQTYGDLVGYMGYGAVGIDSPRNCFNPQKHWTLGWFQDHALSLRVEDLPWGGKMIAFIDYANMASDEDSFVLINVGRSNSRLFLQYNVAKDHNEGTRKHAGKVVIVQDEGTPQRSKGLQSWLVGAIDDFDPTFRYENFDGTGNALVIKVCGKINGSIGIDLLRLSIHLDDGTQQPTCDWEWSDFYCDDKPGSFYVDERRGYKDCGWLNRLYSRWGPKLCVPGHPVYDHCEESCGKCFDDCEDTPDETFFVNNVQKYKDCKWLSTRWSWKKRLCRIGKEAFELCHESCNVCDA